MSASLTAIRSHSDVDGQALRFVVDYLLYRCDLASSFKQKQITKEHGQGLISKKQLKIVCALLNDKITWVECSQTQRDAFFKNLFYSHLSVYYYNYRIQVQVQVQVHK